MANSEGSPASSTRQSAGSNQEPLIVLDESIVGTDFSAPRGHVIAYIYIYIYIIQYY